MAKPKVEFSPLQHADGSVSYTSPAGEVILGSVNGPIEVTRRDTQKPEEATLEVLVKPGSGSTGGVGERYVEGLLRGVLSRVILMRDRNLARRGVVVTLVVLGNDAKDGKIEERGGSYISILPALLNAALLALLSGAIPMCMTYVSTAVVVSTSGELVQNPSANDFKFATSVHALAFSSRGHLLLNESDGAFDLTTWEKVYDLARSVCLNDVNETKLAHDGDVDMDIVDNGGTESLNQAIRDAVEDRIRQEFAWKLVDT